MKRKYLLIPIIGVLLFTPSCSDNTNNFDINNITRIEVSAPSSIIVGQTITLGIDVIGSENDEVSITLSDTTLASINGLKLTALKAGNLTLIITSLENQSISTKKDITINSENAKELKVSIIDNNLVTYDSNTKYYTVPLGQSFLVKCEVESKYNQNYKLSYSVSYPSNNQDGNFSLTQNEDNTATCKAMSAYEGISVIIKLFYNENSTTPDITTSIQMHVVDISLESKTKAIEIINNLDDTNLVNSKIEKSLINKEENIEETTNISINSYKDETYVNETTSKNNIVTNNYYYSTNYENRYYVFSYQNSDKSILNLYANEKIDSSSLKDGSNFFIINNNIVNSGLSSYIGRFLSSSIENSLLLFQDSNIYAYSSFSFSDTSIKVTSNYTNEENTTYNLELNINYSLNQLTSYNFKETITSSYSSLTYEEKGDNFIYKEKEENTNKVIDMDKYFFSEETFDVEVASDKDSEGRYDFSNPSKYFAGSPSLDENNELTYTLATDQSLALRIKRKENADTIATTAIDTFTMTSSNNEVIEASTMLSNSTSLDGSGIFVLSAYKDSKGNITPGKSKITFTSLKGVTYSFNIEFIKNSLSSITVGGPTISDSSNKYDLGEIFLNDLSSYFTINGDPDDNSYNWKLSIIEGNSDGLELYHYEDGNIDNLYGYAIKGVKVGTYSFKIGCVGSSIETTNTYTIKVVDSYSIENISSNIVNETYTYKMGDSYTYTLYFDSESSLTLTQDISYEDAPTSTSLSYYIEKGRIVLDETDLPSTFYYSKIKGDIKYSSDFSSLKLYLAITSSGEETSTSTYTTVTFTKYVDKSDPMNYLKGKSSTTQANVYLEDKYQNYNFTLAFASLSNSATVNIERASDKENVATITFDYTYNEKYTQFTLSNIVSTSDITIIDSYPYYSLNTSYGDYIQLKFNNKSLVRFEI